MKSDGTFDISTRKVLILSIPEKCWYVPYLKSVDTFDTWKILLERCWILSIRKWKVVGLSLLKKGWYFRYVEENCCYFRYKYEVLKLSVLGKKNRWYWERKVLIHSILVWKKLIFSILKWKVLIFSIIKGKVLKFTTRVLIFEKQYYYLLFKESR